MNKIEFSRVKNDIDGNPRFVCHFLNLDVHGHQSGIGLSERYQLALALAKTIGGRKFHNKQYGGGIVFQSYSLQELVKDISRITGKQFDSYSEE